MTLCLVLNISCLPKNAFWESLENGSNLTIEEEVLFGA